MVSASEVVGILHHVNSSPTNVLVLGDHAQDIADFLTDSKVEVPDIGENQVVDYLRNASSAFDAVIANHAVAHFGLSDDELQEFFSGILGSLKADGVFVFREDLGGSKKTLATYTDLLDVFRESNPSDPATEIGFRLLSAQEIRSSIAVRRNWLDIAWTLRKSTFPKQDHDGAATFRQFLDVHQYQDTGIGAYEWIFGAGYISPGGHEENAKFVARLNLKSSQRVLDVGCGIGGNAFYMAQEYGVDVVGADLSSNMLTVALERAGRNPSDTRVSFIVADAMEYDFEPGTFDAIYSRDCIIHIADKETLFKRFFKWLRPGGVVVMTDYCVGEVEFTPEFKAYLEDRKYGLRPIATYVKSFEAAGFKDVWSEDMTERFREILLEEMGKAEKNSEEFAAKFPGKKYDDLVSGWKNKLGYIAAGNHKWAQFYAKKPE